MTFTYRRSKVFGQGKARYEKWMAGMVLACVTALAVAAAALQAPLAAARDDRWVEARTPHFTVVSDAGERKAREVALEFEHVRALMRQADPQVALPGPVLVAAAANEGTLRQLIPQFWERDGRRPAAASWKGTHAHYIAVRADVRDADRGRLFLHEYTHLLVRTRAPGIPAWLDEGLAEFWSTLAAVPAGLEAGAPPPQHLRTLARAQSWTPLAAFLAARDAPQMRNRRDVAAYYAQSWALAHYMMIGAPAPGRGDAPSSLLPDAYVSALRNGTSPAEAAAVFGGVDSLDRAITAYVRSGEIRSKRRLIATSEAGEVAPAVAIRTLSPAASLALRAFLLIEGPRPAAALPLLEQALLFEPAAPGALEARGYYHFVRSEPAEAAVWFDKAISTGAATYLAYYYRAVLSGTAPRQVVENHLRRAIDLNPAFAPAYIRLADMYVEAGRTADALRLLERAAALEPEDAATRAQLERLRKEAARAPR